MLTFLSYLLIVLFIVYARQILSYYRGLANLRAGTNNALNSFTILISARNEEANIEECVSSLLRQQYPKEKLSIIVIDDQSSDRTSQIVRQMIPTSPFSLTVLSSDISSPITSPKVRALTAGIDHSTSDIIVTTDADCIASPQWISSINSYFDDHIGLVAGLTIYDTPKDSHSSLFWGIQYLDFLSYSAVGAGAIGLGTVVMCHGSNMAFRRTAYDECGGFHALAHINSGTDSLLAQRIVSSGKWKARFMFEHTTAITTHPVETWQNVLHQRLRWVGQTAYYPPHMLFFMICTFIMFVGLMIALPLTAMEWNILPWFVFGGVMIVDFMTMYRFSILTGTTNAMKYFLPTAIIHIPFILISTIGGYFFSFRWKERMLKREYQS